jgi:ABC-type uncharacterized transport system ATPase subunit
LKGAIKGLFAREKVKKVAVDDISFTIADGEIVGYIGSPLLRLQKLIIGNQDVCEMSRYYS